MDLSKELQVIISNYEPKFILLCDHSDWRFLTRVNFGLEFDASVPVLELRALYIEKCFRQKMIYGGFGFTLIRSHNGKLATVGINYCGQLGHGDKKSREMFEEIKGTLYNVAHIVCHYSHTLMLLRNGKILSCGDNQRGQLGYGDTLNRMIFEEIPGITQNVEDVKCGDGYTMILLDDGKVLSCGYNKNGQLGHGDNINKFTFEEIKTLPRNVSEIICGLCYAFIRLSNWIIMSCGYNGFGQLGHGDGRDRTVFEEIREILCNIAKIVCCDCYTMILLCDGRVLSCGGNGFGQLGHGYTQFRSTVEEIRGLPGTVSEIVHCDNHVFILLTDGRLLGCGDNQGGQLGHGCLKYVSTFREIAGLARNISQVVC